MAIVDLLVSIGQVAKAIYDQVELAKANQAQCKTLSQRVMIVIAAVQKLSEQKNTDHYRPALEDLQRCLEECLEFIKGFVMEDSWFMKMVQAGSHESQFKDFTERLFKAAQLLDLGLSAQQLIDQLRDTEDRKRDTALFLQKQQELAQLVQQGNQAQQQAQQEIMQRLMSMKKQIKAQQAPALTRGVSAEFITAHHEIICEEPPLAAGVYRGQWREQVVAVKTIEGELTEEDTAEFLKEVENMSRLHAPNIVALYAACVPPETPCLVMEYMAEGSLYAQLGRQPHFTVEQKRKIALGIATGLNYLHAQERIHRDLNSFRVLLDEHGVAKLSNFGLSKRISSIQSLRPVTQGLEWQAPECLSRKKATKASDIYSFGIILWELYTEKRPYAGKTQRELLNFVLTGGRESLQDLDETMARVIQACWAERPEDRPTAKALIKQLSAETHLCVESVSAPNAETLYARGIDFEQKKQFESAFVAYREAAALGHIKANTNCAFCYLKGQGTAMDKQEAYQRFLHSAQAGHARAMVNLAGMREKGAGIAADPQEALHWYAQAAALGDLKAEAKRAELQQKWGIAPAAVPEVVPGVAVAASSVQTPEHSAVLAPAIDEQPQLMEVLAMTERDIAILENQQAVLSKEFTEAAEQLAQYQAQISELKPNNAEKLAVYLKEKSELAAWIEQLEAKLYAVKTRQTILKQVLPGAITEREVSTQAEQLQVLIKEAQGLSECFVAGRLGLINYYHDLCKRQSSPAHRSLAAQPPCLRMVEGHSHYILDLVALPEGRFASSSNDKTIRIWDHAGLSLGVLNGHTSTVSALVPLPNGHLASGSWDNTIRIWDLQTGQARILKGHTGPVYALALLSNGDLVSGSGDNTIRVWDLKTGLCRSTLKGHTSTVFALAVLPNDQLVSGSGDCSLRIWNLNEGKQLRLLKGHKDSVSTLLAYSENKLLTGSHDKTIRVWDLQAGTTLNIFEGHTDYVHALSRLPDGLFASGSRDKTIRIWNVETGVSLRTLEGHTGPITTLLNLQEGVLASGSHDKTIRLWEVCSAVPVLEEEPVNRVGCVLM